MNSLVIVEANKVKKIPLKVQNTALMMNLLMAFILAFYFQKWHFMAFWDSKFGIPLAKNVGNTETNSICRHAKLLSGGKKIIQFSNY